MALVVSTDSAVRGAANTLMPLAGWKVQDVPSYTLAMHNLKVTAPDALLVEQKFQEGDALILMRGLRNVPGWEKVTVCLLVDSIDRAMAVNYVRAGIHIFLAKPLDMVDVCAKLADKVPGASRLQAPQRPDDPLARPVMVVASPNLNLQEMATKTMNDEFDMVLFDGSRGLDTDRRYASVLLVDDGLPGGGLEALNTWRTLFGDSPAIAVTGRGGEQIEGYAGTLVKPVRDASLRRVARQLTGRLHFGIFPMATGVVLRIREGWQAADDATFQGFLMRLGELADLTLETKRKWLCLDGPYLGAAEYLHRTRMLYEAASRLKLHVGLVTLQSDTAHVAIRCNIRPAMVHNKTADFIKLAQEWV